MFALLAIAVLVGVTLFLRAWRPQPWIEGSPPFVPGWPLIGSLEFYTRRATFLSSLKGIAPITAFSVAQHNIVNLSGDENRQAFLTRPTLSAAESQSGKKNKAAGTSSSNLARSISHPFQARRATQLGSLGMQMTEGYNGPGIWPMAHQEKLGR